MDAGARHCCASRGRRLEAGVVLLMAVLAAWAIGVSSPCIAAATETPEADRSGTADIERWKERHAEAGKTPEGALQIWFEAVFLYLDPQTRDVARQALQYLTIPLKDDDQWERRPSNSRFVSRLVHPEHHHIFRSYAQGATPENGYAMDPGSFQLRIRDSGEDAHGRGWRVLLVSSGADNPRPVYLRRSTSTGLWFVDGFANVYVGIRPPASESEEQFE